MTAKSNEKEDQTKPWVAKSWFTIFAQWTSHAAGRPVAFVIAVLIVLIWGITGPIFHFSDTWQLVINTGTTIVTFLMVFLIKNTQNRDTEALQIKLDELIRAMKLASNELLDLDELDDKQLEKIKTKYEKLGKKAREGIEKASKGTNTTDK